MFDADSFIFILGVKVVIAKNFLVGMQAFQPIETLHKENTNEEKHSKNVGEICRSIGKAMGLSDEEVRRVTEAKYFHDIGK